MSDLLRHARNNLARYKDSELNQLNEVETLKDLWEKKQKLVQEMNKAKKLASEEAAKPYLDLIAEIDKQYAMWLNMTFQD